MLSAPGPGDGWGGYCNLALDCANEEPGGCPEELCRVGWNYPRVEFFADQARDGRRAPGFERGQYQAPLHGTGVTQ